MAIFVPGRRDHRNRPLNANGKRSIVAMLSMTAMVDMFTVLAIFLLQNYESTDQVIEITDKVQLPKAGAVKEIKPATVVIVSKTNITVNNDNVAQYQQVKEQQDWMIASLQQKLQAEFKHLEEKRHGPLGNIRKAVDAAKELSEKEQKLNDSRVTVQADKSVDFLTLKKVMFTVTEAGASQINFAVLKDTDK